MKRTYAEKKEQQKAGTYHGPSPFFNNIPQFQHLKELSSYPHLAQPGMKVGRWDRLVNQNIQP